MKDPGCGEVGCERAAGAEGHEYRLVARRGERSCEEHRLPFGAARAQPVLEDDYFHCSGGAAGGIVSGCGILS